MLSRIAVPVALTAVLAANVPGRADEATVLGSGSADIQVMPEIMRVRIELTTKGKDVKEAVEKLKGRRDTAREKLIALGANKETISFTDPGVGTEAMTRERMMRGGWRAPPDMPGQPGAKSKGPQPVFVSTSVSAEFPLKAAGGDEFLVSVSALQDKTRAAELGGLKDTGKLTAQEEEIAEERGVQATGQDGGPKPGEPLFLFVGHVDEGQRTKAAADAFQKAKRQAARLARAANGELGEVRDIRETVGPGSTSDESDPESQYYAQQMAYAWYGRQGAGDDNSEPVSPKAGRVSLRIVVMVKYSLKPSNPR